MEEPKGKLKAGVALQVVEKPPCPLKWELSPIAIRMRHRTGSNQSTSLIGFLIIGVSLLVRVGLTD